MSDKRKDLLEMLEKGSKDYQNGRYSTSDDVSQRIDMKLQSAKAQIEMENEARRIYAGLDYDRRNDALNLFLRKFGDQGAVTLPDVAEYILMRLVSCRADVLHCLCYFAQGFCLAKTGKPLFGEDFRALRTGPCCDFWKGCESNEGTVTILEHGIVGGNPYKLTKDQKAIIDAVISENATYAPELIVELAAKSAAYKETKFRDIISKKAIRKYFKQELSIRKKEEFENHNPYLMKLLTDEP